jgi:hypothetical protein
MKVASRPVYKLNKTSLTLRELKMYTYCSEYFREYFDKQDIPLHDSRSHEFLLFQAMLKYMVSFKEKTGVWPNDQSVLNTFLMLNESSIESGSGIFWPNKKNDFFLALIDLRTQLQKVWKSITWVSKEYKFLSSTGLEVKSSFLFGNPHLVYILIDSSDPLSYLDVWLSKYSSKRRLRIINFRKDSLTISFEEYNLSTSGKRDVKEKLETICRGISSNTYIPVFNCTRACPHSNLCNRTGSYSFTPLLHST